MLDFHDYAAGVDYPFIAGTGMRVGSYSLPTDAFLDAGIVIYGEYAPVPLVSVRRAGDGFVAAFGTPGQPLLFEGREPGVLRAANANASGFLLVGPGLPELAARMAAGNEYPGRNAVLEPGRVQALDGYCVMSLNLYNGGTPAARGVTGDVTFSPGYSMRVGVNAEDNAVVFVSALGAGLGVRCWPENEADDPCAGFVRSVNGATADSIGNLTLSGGPRVEINEFPDEHKIVVDFTKAFIEGECEA
jgi:hypothetical protein